MYILYWVSHLAYMKDDLQVGVPEVAAAVATRVVKDRKNFILYTG